MMRALLSVSTSKSSGAEWRYQHSAQSINTINTPHTHSRTSKHKHKRRELANAQDKHTSHSAILVYNVSWAMCECIVDKKTLFQVHCCCSQGESFGQEQSQHRRTPCDRPTSSYPAGSVDHVFRVRTAFNCVWVAHRMNSLIMSASSDSEFLSALNKSPADRCTYPSFSSSAMRAHWVPLPDPGPPRTNTTCGTLEAASDCSLLLFDFCRRRRRASTAARLMATPATSATESAAVLWPPPNEGIFTGSWWLARKGNSTAALSYAVGSAGLCLRCVEASWFGVVIYSVGRRVYCQVRNKNF